MPNYSSGQNGPKITNWKEADQFLGKKQYRPLHGTATSIHRQSTGTIAVWYHDTDIVTYYKAGYCKLRAGYHYTSTTKGKMNEYSRTCVFQEKGVWYVRSWSTPSMKAAAFTEDMIVKDDGTLPIETTSAGVYTNMRFKEFGYIEFSLTDAGYNALASWVATAKAVALTTSKETYKRVVQENIASIWDYIDDPRRNPYPFDGIGPNDADFLIDMIREHINGDFALTTAIETGSLIDEHTILIAYKPVYTEFEDRRRLDNWTALLWFGREAIELYTDKLLRTGSIRLYWND